MANHLKIVTKIFVTVGTTFFQFIISQIITLLVIPVAIIVYIINTLLIRNILSLYLYIRFGGKMKLVSDSGDAMFGYKSEGNTRNILIAIQCKMPPLNTTEFKNNIVDKKVGNKKPYEKLRWIFTKHMGYFCWKLDENFNIKNHFIVLSHDEVVTQERLHEIVAECRRDMSEDHPQWQFIFVPNCINENGVQTGVIITRFHHGILDGLSFVTFVSHCLGVIAPEDEDETNRIIESGTWTPKPLSFPYILNPLKFAIPLKYKILYNINCMLFGFYHLLKTLTKTSSHWKLRGTYPGKDKYYAASGKIDNTTMKVIREGCKVSVPSILAFCFLQALEKVVGSRVPEKVTIGHSLAILPYPDEFFHNRFTLMSVLYRRTTKLSRTEKVKAYHRQSMAALQGPEYSLYYWLFQFYGKLPAFLFKYPLKKARFSFFLNNLPFAKKPLLVFNSLITDVKGWPPYTTDAGIGLTSVGYCDTITVGATADSSWLTKDELHMTMIEMEREIKLLAKECASHTV